MKTIFALLAGLIFGFGLILSGMSNPAKVLGFLDLAGAWDPSLALVMGGALLPASVAFYIAKRRGSTLLGSPLVLPQTRQIDRRLIGGSVLFGVGWGLAGICPGPALVLVGIDLQHGTSQGLLFAAAMLIGMLIFSAVERISAKRRA